MNETLSIIDEIYNQITFNNAWQLIILFLLGKTIIGLLNAIKQKEFKVSILFLKATEDFKWLTIVYMFFIAYALVPVTLFEMIARVSVATIIGIEAKSTLVLAQKLASSQQLAMPNQVSNYSSELSIEESGEPYIAPTQEKNMQFFDDDKIPKMESD